MNILALILVIVASSSYACVDSSSSESVTSSSSSSVGKIDLRFSWIPPTEREGGEKFSLSEIGGYEIRYRRATETAFKVIPNVPKTSVKYRIPDVPNDDYHIEISVYDINYLYSSFVPTGYNMPPKPVTRFMVKASSVH